jgi:phosphomethylpyrimidine synthase
MEVERKIAEQYGADTLMDLSVGGDIEGTGRRLGCNRLPVGTVLIYEAFLQSKIRACVNMPGRVAV